MRILTEPKNALVRQYQRLFEMEDVQLTFADEAMRTIAKKAIERKTGARGPPLDHGGHPARHHVRAAVAARRRGGRDQLRGGRGQGAAAAHLLRPARRAGIERMTCTWLIPAC